MFSVFQLEPKNREADEGEKKRKEKGKEKGGENAEESSIGETLSEKRRDVRERGNKILTLPGTFLQ